MNLSNIAGLAWLAPIIMLYGQIKSFLLRLSTILVVRVKITGRPASHLHCQLWKEWKHIKFGPTQFVGVFERHREINDLAPVMIEVDTKPAIFWLKGKLVIWTVESESQGTLTYIRGWVNGKKLIEKAGQSWYGHENESLASLRSDNFYVENVYGSITTNNKNAVDSMFGNADPAPHGGGGAKMAHDSPGAGSMDSVLRIVRGAGKRAVDVYPMYNRVVDEFGTSKKIKPFSRYYLDPSMQVLRDEFETFIKAKTWMRERGIPCKRGLMLYGAPGTGKSALVRVLAEEYGIPILKVHLATFCDADVEKLYKKVTAGEPKIILLEDIDAIFVGRENQVKHDGPKLSFETLLNMLSGVDPLLGMVIMTTNHIEKLDPALLRPGRVDRKVEVPYLSKEGRTSLANRIMNGLPQAEIDAMVESSKDQPAANWENECIQAAFKWYWQHHLKDSVKEDEQGERNATVE
jgi:hypothetical protein